MFTPAIAVHAVRGFLGRRMVKTAHLVDAGGKRSAMIIFVDLDQPRNRVLPIWNEMATPRLIGRENVAPAQRNLD